MESIHAYGFFKVIDIFVTISIGGMNCYPSFRFNYNTKNAMVKVDSWLLSQYVSMFLRWILFQSHVVHGIMIVSEMWYALFV